MKGILIRSLGLGAAAMLSVGLSAGLSASTASADPMGTVRIDQSSYGASPRFQVSGTASCAGTWNGIPAQVSVIVEENSGLLTQAVGQSDFGALPCDGAQHRWQLEVRAPAGFYPGNGVEQVRVITGGWMTIAQYQGPARFMP